MLLSLREMDVFRRVMELGSVTAAAAALNISQPAVSRLLQHAEQRLGFALFVRQKKRLVPTAEAHALFPETIAAFAAIDAAQRLAGGLRTGQSGTLTLAVIPALANALLPRAVQRFRAARPDVSVVIQALTAHEIANRVADYRADLGVIIGPIASAGVSVSDLCATRLGCVLPRRHALAKKSSLHPADLADTPLICLSRHLPLGNQTSRLFADANVPLRIAVEVSQSATALALVRAGAGIALLDGFAFGGVQGQDLVIRPLRPDVESVARVLQARDRPLSRLAQEFLKTLQQVASEMNFTVPAAGAGGPTAPGDAKAVAGRGKRHRA
ncbi:MAG: LysR substrate-binding domain-containing protein [Ferrovibrio sp.]|uniref:LysR substrate-binding domain-containing protein n=1 Tax=Ferrovibrio sp. TaxID=1917215 RepID=UPI00262014E4|nr:LysR substrate-binding domain-containing protein [Ferrovibrio sp.]MCW0232294.1 LysR substrate-binding domain-containing protein [Ferrovibrio sp.]